MISRRICIVQQGTELDAFVLVSTGVTTQGVIGLGTLRRDFSTIPAPLFHVFLT